MLHLNLELPLSPDFVCRVSHSDNNRRNKSHIPQQSRSNFIRNPLQFCLFGIAHKKSLISLSLCRILFQLRHTKNQLKTIVWYSRGLQSLAIVCTECTEQFSIEMQNVAFAAAPLFQLKNGIAIYIHPENKAHLHHFRYIYIETIFPWYFRRAWNAKNMQIFRWWCCLVKNLTLECKIIFLDGFQQYKMFFCAVFSCIGPSETDVNHFKVTDLSKTTPCIPKEYASGK